MITGLVARVRFTTLDGDTVDPTELPTAKSMYPACFPRRMTRRAADFWRGRDSLSAPDTHPMLSV